jgi:selenocysteine lyase/cysteine desulfurase
MPRSFLVRSSSGAPNMVLEQRAAWGAQCEARPDPWFRGGFQNVTRQVRATWAAYVNADEADLVLVENTSSGMNSIIRSLPFQSGDGVLVLDTAYDMVVNTLAYVAKRYDLQVLTATTVFPVVDETSFTGPLAQTIASAPTGFIKVCIFSHITSLPAVIVPIELLAAQCKAIGAAVVIDGAHAVGQISVDITALAAVGVDFYVANGHKW